MLVFFTATTGAGIVTADFHGCHLGSNNPGNEPPIDHFEEDAKGHILWPYAIPTYEIE